MLIIFLFFFIDVFFTTHTHTLALYIMIYTSSLEYAVENYSQTQIHTTTKNKRRERFTIVLRVYKNLEGI